MISISLLSIKDCEQKIKKMDELGANYIHLDIMDGMFVSNKVDFLEVSIQNTPLEVHFMVCDVKKYVDLYLKYHPEYMTFHLESGANIEETIEYIKSKNVKVGLAINPNTSVESLYPYLNKLDLVLVMSVEPGAGGQKFIQSSISKIKELKEIRERNSYHYLIEVDGGINKDTKIGCRDADILVVGSYVSTSDDYLEKFENMKQ